MIKLFKIKKRKVWHIYNDRNGSYCRNARTFNLKEKGYNPRIDEDYIDMMRVKEIPHEIHDGLCKACVQHAFSDGIIKIVANND